MSVKIVDLLKNELGFADFALERFKSEMKPYEKEYSMEWKEFMDKFESGKLGDVTFDFHLRGDLA